MKEALVSKISYDILSGNRGEQKISAVQNTVREYDVMLDEVVRNFYEVKMDGAPLFDLCEHIKYGRDNYGMEEDEFNEKIKSLLIEVNKTFNVNYTL